MMTRRLLFSVMLFAPLLSSGQDTIVIDLATSSRVVFTIQDHADLEQLRMYDYQALFDDILYQLDPDNADPYSGRT
jgi:hypothetical protein